MPGEQVFQLAVAIYFPIYFTLSLILNITLLMLIMTKTTTVLKQMKVFLYASTIVNLIVSTISVFTQVRNVTNVKSSALLCQGICKYAGPDLCFHFYNAVKTAVMIAGIVNMNTLYYRMILIKYREQSMVRMRLILFSLVYFVPVAIPVMSYIPEIDFEAVYAETLRLHPEYNYEPYLKFPGFANSHSIYNSLNTFVLAFFMFAEPILGYFWRRSSFKVLHENLNSLSTNSILQIRSFLNALTLQIIMPLICYVPFAGLFLIAKYSGTQFLAGQFISPVLTSFPAIMDPILALYFIKQYRMELQKIIANVLIGVVTKFSLPTSSTNVSTSMFLRRDNIT